MQSPLPISGGIPGSLVALALVLLSSGWLAPAQAQNNNSGAVTGYVKDLTGKPIEGVEVWAIGATDERSKRTSDQGSYLFEHLLPGKYEIKAIGRPSNFVPITLDVPLNNTETIRAPDITLGCVLLVVRVFDSANRLLSKANVTVVNVKTNLEETPANRNDEEAPFRYYLPDEKFKLSASSCLSGYIWRTSTEVAIKFDVTWGPREQKLRLDEKLAVRCSSRADVSPRPPSSTPDELAARGLVADIELVLTAEDGADESGPLTQINPYHVTPLAASNAKPELVQTAAQSPSGQPPPVPKVEVGAASLLLINTISAARSTHFTERQIGALPLGGRAEMRTYDELAFLAPGVAPPPYTFGPRGPGVGFGVNTAGDFAVNGMRARANNFTVDGSDNNDPDVGGRRQGFVALVPQPLESIKGFSISTLLWNAELGRNFGAQVNSVSKYGERGYHGQAYVFLTDESLNARNFFDYTDKGGRGKDEFSRTQAGLTLGGPLTRRTYFFASGEHIDTSASSEQHFATPTLAERRFLGRAPEERFGVLFLPGRFLGNGANVYNTVLDGTPLGGNILSFYEPPNTPCAPPPNNEKCRGPYGKNTYTQVLPADSDGTVLSFKATHQFAPNYLLNARYNFTDDERMLPSINRAIRSALTAQARTQNLSLIFDGPLTARQFIQARFSYGRTRLGFAERPDNLLCFSATSSEQVDLPDGSRASFTSETGDLGQVIVEPFSPVGIDVFTIPQSRVNNTFQASQSISYPIGAHAIKFGSDILRFQFNSHQERNYRPQVVYGNALLVNGRLRNTFNPSSPFAFTQTQREQFVRGVQLAALGVAASSFQTLVGSEPSADIGLRYTQYSFFADDTWRVRPNFTLAYGLRYEYNTVPREVNGRIERALRLEDLPLPEASQLNTEATKKFMAARNAYCRVLAGYNGTDASCELLPKRTQIYDDDPNNFGPRVGFAWNPRSDGKTAVRAGYGIYYGAVLGALVSQSRNIFPLELPVTIDPSFFGVDFDVFRLNTPSQIQVGGLPLVAPQKSDQQLLNKLNGGRENFAAMVGELLLRNRLGGGLAFTLPSKKLASPYAQQWHLTLEREMFGDYLVTAAYVGTRGVKLTRLTTPNLGPNGTTVIPVALPKTGANILDYPLIAYAAQAQPSINPLLLPSRPEPDLGAYQIFENSAASGYHALQLEARKRYARNFTFTAAYTWSHAIDDVSDIFPLAGAPVVAQNSLKLREERASANFDVRHRFAASLVWELPFYRATTGRNALWLGGWQLAAIFQAHTGQPFTLNVPFDVNRDGNLTDRPSTTQGLQFFSEHGPQRVDLMSEVRYTCFFLPDESCDPVQAGVVGRNTVRSDSLINLNLALNKKFRFGNERQLEFRAEFFNLLNRANFGLPIRTIGNPGFGSAVETITPARIIQFALKYSF